ncbi:MAG: hypothetical protein BWK78_07925 [Thiotrichaceae bacterium IS1]|nr:MAG: hypothetical protein BWK78_07925 [Thiotrichaceae bacterium IS1]
MQVTLSITLTEIDHHLLNLLRNLLSQNAEIILRKAPVKLEEFDKHLPLTQVMQEMAQAGHNQAFLKDLQTGLATATVYQH